MRAHKSKISIQAQSKHLVCKEWCRKDGLGHSKGWCVRWNTARHVFRGINRSQSTLCQTVTTFAFSTKYFERSGEICFVLPSYKLLWYLQGLSGTDECCWSVALRWWGLLLLIKGWGSAWEKCRRNDSLEGHKEQRSTRWWNGEGKQSRKVIPIAAN